MKKGNQQILNTKERSRYQISSEYFSKGASKQLVEQFTNTYVEKIKKQSNQFKNFKKDKKEKKNSKSQVAKFLGVAAIATVISVVVIKKLKDGAEKLKEITDIGVGGLQVDERSKIKRFSDDIKAKAKENISEPVQAGLKAIFGTNYEALKNPELREKGLWGTLLPDFALLTLIYVFRKEGYSWLLKFLNIRQPYYHYMVKGMWDVFVDDPTGYMVMGRTLFEGAGAQVMMRDAVTNMRETATLYKDYAVTEWLNDNRVEDTSDQVSEVIEHYSNHTRLIKENKFVWRDLEDYEFSTWDDEVVRWWEFWRSEESGTPYPQKCEDYADEEFEDYVKDYKEHNRVVLSPTKFLFINDEYNYFQDMYSKFGDYDLFSSEKLGRWIQIFNKRGEGQGDGDDEFWTARKLNILLQMNAAIRQWQLYQELNSLTAARAMYSEMFTETYNEELIASVGEELINQRREAEQFQKDFANGKITLQQFMTATYNSLDKIIKKGFLSELKVLFNLRKQDHQKKIKNNLVKEMIQKISTNIKKLKLNVIGGGRQVVTINNQTFRENFSAEGKVGAQFAGLKGQFFDGVAVKNSKVNIYSNSDINMLKKLGYRKGWAYLMLWKKTAGKGLAPWVSKRDADFKTMWGNDGGQWGWVQVSDTKAANVPYYWVGYDDGADCWGYAWRNELVDSVDEVANEYLGLPSWAPGGRITADVYTQKSPQYAEMWFLEQLVGSKETYRYEVIDDGKFYIVDLDVFTKHNGTVVTRDEIMRRESKSSNAALFYGNYTTAEEGVTIEQQIINVLDTADLAEKRKKELLKERYEILGEILNNKNNTSLQFYEIS